MAIALVKQLDLDSIKRWAATGSNKLNHPVSIGAACAGCSKQVVFSTKRRHYDANRDTVSCSGECPACNSPSHFWITNIVAQSNADESDEPQVFMMPSAKTRMDLKALTDTLPSSVLQYCQSTQDVYFSGNLTATNIMVQSTIEAMFNSFLAAGNSRTSLAQVVRDSISSIDLDQPLVALSASLRDEGHLQALFSQNEQTDQETADAFMSLVESLVTYLYIIPKEFNDLYERLDEIGKTAMSNARDETANRSSDDADSRKRVDRDDGNDDYEADRAA